MSAGEQEPKRGKGEASHAASVAQKLLCWVVLACSCDDDPSWPPVDPNDLDGDGIPNERDVCPTVQDPTQHDEDGDKIGDICDICPTVADPLQSDRGELDVNAFEDGVGDACDMRPTRGGDKMRALHTFATDTATSWLGEGWTIADDRAAAVAGAAARWQHKRAEQGDAVFARLAIESLAFVAEGGALALALDGDGIESGRVCALFFDRNDDAHDELEVRELGGAIIVRELTVPLTPPLELVLLRGIDRMGKGKILCRLLTGDGKKVEASFDTDDVATTGQYVFAATGSDVVVTSLVVYGSPVSCPTLSLACPLP